MKKLSKVQLITIALIIGYIIWEVFVRIWEVKTGEVNTIRVDLIIIYPILLILILISVIQYFKR